MLNEIVIHMDILFSSRSEIIKKNLAQQMWQKSLNCALKYGRLKGY